jgi:DtxR family transcriptional regulator, Mn-dependent transcriptional regulator
MSKDTPAITESTESYLENILRLGQKRGPVPLARLADALGVSPISVNQMCRKLQDQGLVDYVPYKGVSCTPEGCELAARVLRRHRLWEVFLVERLEMDWEEAHEAACQLEHSTPESVEERLDAFLGHPQVNPRGDPIPAAGGIYDPPVLRALAEVEVGQRVYYVRCTGDATTCAFLLGQGFRAGAPMQVLASAPEGLLLQVGDRNLALQRTVAETVLVGAQGSWIGSQDGEHPAEASESQQVPLAHLRVGQRGIVLRVGGDARLHTRLLEMGLVPGETIIVEHMAPLGDPMRLRIKGYCLSLRREEAAYVLVEMGGSGVDETAT